MCFVIETQVAYFIPGRIAQRQVSSTLMSKSTTTKSRRCRQRQFVAVDFDASVDKPSRVVDVFRSWEINVMTLWSTKTLIENWPLTRLRNAVTAVSRMSPEMRLSSRPSSTSRGRMPALTNCFWFSRCPAASRLTAVDKVDKNESGASWRSYIPTKVWKPSGVRPNAVLIATLSLTTLPIASTICYNKPV